MSYIEALDYENPIVNVLWAEDREPDWLVKDMILQSTMVCLAGEPGAGKSYVSYTLGLALASGVSALSGIIPAGTPKTVLYFDDENSEGDRNKYLSRSWWGLADSHGKKPDEGLLNDHFIPVHFRLGEPDWFEVAARFVEHFQPALIVFDTAAACFDIDDENSNAEAAKVIKKIRALMRIPDTVAASIVLKHAKIVSEKGGARSIRGAKAWKSMADQTMFQVRAPGRPRKGGLQLTRLEPDKSRAFGLSETVYITPTWTDDQRTGLLLEGSYRASGEHRRKLAEEGFEEDE